MTAIPELGNPYGPDDATEGKGIVCDGAVEGNLIFRVRSATRRARWYTVQVRMDNGNVMCGYRLEGENDLLEGCEWYRYGHRGNIWNPAQCCRHARAVIERIRPLLDPGLNGILDPASIRALLDDRHDAAPSLFNQRNLL